MGVQFFFDCPHIGKEGERPQYDALQMYRFIVFFFFSDPLCRLLLQVGESRMQPDAIVSVFRYCFLITWTVFLCGPGAPR